MIETRKEQLPTAKIAALATLMAREDFILLTKVIQSRAEEKVLEATNKALEANKHPNKQQLSEALLQEAHRFKTCLDVIEEIKADPNPYLIKYASK